jgi:hypothetical protein
MAEIPEMLRPAVRAQLDALVRGELPEMLLWVHQYGDGGAVLVVQPDEIWNHPWSDVLQRIDGSWSVVVPLWTEDEAPSDLSAELSVDASGTATLDDVHVL